MHNKGQIGDTITWVIATIIIIVILIFFIFGSSMLASTKSVGKYKESLFAKEVSDGDNMFMKKSIYTYINLQSENTKVKIDKFLTNQSASEKWEPSYNQTKILIRGRVGK